MRENQIIEFKSSWRDEYLKWISGFANAQGGKLVIAMIPRRAAHDVQIVATLSQQLSERRCARTPALHESPKRAFYADTSRVGQGNVLA